jgi:hypothetical protein
LVLDQNGDGKVDMSDAMDAVTKKVVGWWHAKRAVWKIN